MDVGCYPVRMLQALFGYDATVSGATATTRTGSTPRWSQR